MESELGRVVDALPGLVWIALPDERFGYVNAAWCEYTGLSAKEACALGWQTVAHPDDLIALSGLMGGAVASAQVVEKEARVRRADGAYRRFLLRMNPLLDPDGTIGKWCGVGTDVEDHLPAHHHGAASDAELYAIVDSIPAFIGLADRTGTMEYFNAFALNYLGATVDELRGGKAVDVIHPDDLEVVMASWRYAVETGSPYDRPHRIRRADGVFRWFHVRGLPLKDKKGLISRWFIVDADIDDQTRDQILLVGENRLLQLITQEVPSASFLEALCLLVEETIRDCRASIVLTGVCGTRMSPGAAPNLPVDFIEATVRGLVDIEAGPCAMAIALNQPVVASDLATESRWQSSGWTQRALSFGLRACYATPVLNTSGGVLGALTIYLEQPRPLSGRETDLIRRLGHIAAITVERKRSQESLARALDEVKLSEDRLRATIDTVPGFVWRAAADGGVEFLNQRWSDYAGISLEDSLGHGWASQIHPADAPGLMTYWQALLEAGRPGSFEARLRRFDGAYRWFLIRAVPLLNDAGRVVNWYGQNADIEDRKRAEALLAGEKHLLGLIANGSPLTEVLAALRRMVGDVMDGAQCSVAVVDPNGRSAPPGALRSLQWSAATDGPAGLLSDADGRPLEAESSPLAWAAVRAEPAVSRDLARETRWPDWCARALSLGIHASWSIPIAYSCGRVTGVLSIFCQDGRSPALEESGLLAQFAHLASIAIERSHTEAALTQSRAFLAKAQELSSTGCLSWHPSVDEVTCSDEIYNIYGVDTSVRVTFDLLDRRIHPDDVPSYRAAFDAHSTRNEGFQHEHRLLMPNGRVKYLQLVAHPTQDLQGRGAYIAAVQDVTQHRLSEEALGKVRSELAHVARVAMLGALTASIAHEVNQPLAGIITNASTCLRMLGADPPNVVGAQETARRTIRDGNRASDVINRLRALFSKKNVAMEDVDLNEAAREVIAMLLGELQRNGVTLYPTFKDGLPLIHGDRVQLQQVILNLIMNASDAMSDVSDRPRRMYVGTDVQAGGAVRFCVRDSGTGFDPADAERLFQAFYTTKPSGMGIGLSVSRSIIEGHDGRLWATQDRKVGATFAFSIPGRRKDGSDSAGDIPPLRSDVRPAGDMENT